MKTIKEIAKERIGCHEDGDRKFDCGHCRLYDRQYECPCMNQINDFISGVNFAQRWIPIEEGLPEETGWMDPPCLVKCKSGRLEVAGFTGGRFHLYSGRCLKPDIVTHWRYIEIPE